MDSLTHIVAGAVIGDALVGKKIGKKAMFWGALANTIPDFDMVMNYFADPVDALIIHRGITHSILFAFAAPLLLMFLFSILLKSSDIKKREWYLLFFTGFISHALLDCMTAYGTGLFEPLSHVRISFNNMFVADPLFTLPFLISFVALLILRKNSPKRKAWNLTAISISSLYIVFTIAVKSHVNNIAESSLIKENKSHSRFFTSPTPLNSLLWMVVAEGEENFYIGYYSIFDKTKIISFEEIPKNLSLIEGAEENELLETLKYFSEGYYFYSNSGDDLFFNDLRFGRISTWGEAKGPFVFQYRLSKDADNSLILEKGRWNSSSTPSKEFKLLIKRISGI